MMTLQEIQKANINPKAAEQAYAEAEKRLTDLLATKAGFETKASTLFSVYITIALALFGAGGTVYSDSGLTALVLGLWVTGCAFVLGSAFFVMALRRQKFGVLGSDPELWLLPDVIAGGDSAVAFNLAYITYHCKNRIQISEASLRSKGHWIEAGIWVGVFAPTLVLIMMVWA